MYDDFLTSRLKPVNPALSKQTRNPFAAPLEFREADRKNLQQNALAIQALKTLRSNYYTQEYGDYLKNELDKRKDELWPVSVDTPEAVEAENSYNNANSAYTQWQTDMYNKNHTRELGIMEAVTLKQGYSTPTINGAEIETPLIGDYANVKSSAKYIFDDTFRMQQDLNALRGSGVSPWAKYSYLTDKEKGVLGYYISQNDWESAGAYLSLLDRALDERTMTHAKQAMQETAEKYPALGVVANVTSSLASPFAWAATDVQKLKNNITGKYEPTNINSPWFTGAQLQQASAQGVHNAAYKAAYEATGNEKAAEVAAFGADTGLSIFNYLTKIPFGPTGALLYMGAESAGQASLQAQQNGASPDQAFALGLVSGLIEMATEKLPLDELLKLGKQGAKGVGDFLLRTTKQGGIEAAEESISQIANTIAEIAIMGEKSGFKQYVGYLISQGYSETDATNEALFQYFVKDVGVAAFSGLVSGNLVGSSATLYGSYNATKSTPDVLSLWPPLNASANTHTTPQLTMPQQTPASEQSASNVPQVDIPGDIKAEPVTIKDAPEIVIDKSSLEAAQEHLKQAEFTKDFAETPESFKNVLLQAYRNIGSTRQVKIDGAVNGKSYEVTINKSAVEKIVIDPKISAEKLAVLQNIDAVVRNSTYVESGKDTLKTGGNKQTIRHDYFEAPVTIGGEKYTVRLDVAVNKSTGRNTVTGIDVIKAPETGGGPNTIPDSVPDRSTEDISRQYIEQFQQMLSSGAADNNTATLVNNKGAGYNGSILTSTEGMRDVSDQTLDFIEFHYKSEAQKWGINEYSTWEIGLSAEEKSAVTAYTGDECYQNINAVLRGAESQYIGDNEQIALQLSQALSKAVIPRNLTLFRGASRKMLGKYIDLPSEQLIGKVISDKAFISASLVNEGAFDADLTLIIEAPGGTHGAYIGNLSYYPDEAEVLINKEQQMVIKEVLDADTNNMKIVVEIIP